VARAATKHHVGRVEGGATIPKLADVVAENPNTVAWKVRIMG
jgi:hypothetical protein